MRKEYRVPPYYVPNLGAGENGEKEEEEEEEAEEEQVVVEEEDGGSGRRRWSQTVGR